MKTIPEIHILLAAANTAYNALPRAASTQQLTLTDSDEGVTHQLPANKREGNKLLREIEFLTFVRNYLETDPTAEYIHGETTRLRTLIANLSKIDPPKNFYPDNYTGDPIAYFNKKMGIIDMHKQIKMLEYIIEI